MKARLKTSGSWAGRIDIKVNGETEYSTKSQHNNNLTYSRPLEKNDTFAVVSKDVNGNLNIEIKIEGSDKL